MLILACNKTETLNKLTATLHMMSRNSPKLVSTSCFDKPVAINRPPSIGAFPVIKLKAVGPSLIPSYVL